MPILVTRRAFGALLGGAALAPALANDSRMTRLLVEARRFPELAARIDFISKGLLGSRYRSDTLIGGPDKPEVFVTRDDVFDCVTFCEVVLAAARSRSPADYEPELRKIRYHNGVVGWRERNHDFAAWCARNVENGIFRRVDFPGQVEISKVMTSPAALGRRTYSFAAVPRAVLLKHKDTLKTGDVMGFVSARSGLDYYHCAFVIADGNEITLRHAALSAGRAFDQKLEAFIAANGTRNVTVLRPQPV